MKLPIDEEAGAPQMGRGTDVAIEILYLPKHHQPMDIMDFSFRTIDGKKQARRYNLSKYEKTYSLLDLKSTKFRNTRITRML